MKARKIVKRILREGNCVFIGDECAGCPLTKKYCLPSYSVKGAAKAWLIDHPKKKLTEERVREIIKEEMSVHPVTAEETPGDGNYLYFGGEGQEKDPRLPQGVKVEVRDNHDDDWRGLIYIGYIRQAVSFPYATEDTSYRFLRVKKSEIIDIGERAVGRLVEAWNDGEEPVRGVCRIHHSDGDYSVRGIKDTRWYKHVRIINNSEVTG